MSATNGTPSQAGTKGFEYPEIDGVKAPYPFCSQPEICCKAGRCERRTAMATFGVVLTNMGLILGIMLIVGLHLSWWWLVPLILFALWWN